MGTKRTAVSPWGALALAVLITSCIKQRCYEDHDCPSSQICSASGACVLECDESRPCSSGFQCVHNRCTPRPQQPITCPFDMVKVADTFCVDRFEASRSDATDVSQGQDDSRALSVAGVLPWQVADNTTAQAACEAVGKRLCETAEWRTACKGPLETVYSYGDSYEPATCNGIDAFGIQSFHLAATGAFPSCTNAWGVFDMNGNLWEHVAGGNDMTVRGGAFNCGDSAALHKCDYVPGNWTPSARGFRCCLTPVPTDAGTADIDASAGAKGEAGGCVGGEDAKPDGPGRADAGDKPDRIPVDATLADAPQACPSEMAQVGGICVDRWEASRSDATATSGGKNETVALSRPGVLPWYVNPMSASVLDRFQTACRAQGKRLCTSAEWFDACRGPDKSTYFFGADWNPATCNSVDSHCQKCCDVLGLPNCPTGENCGYSSLLSSSYIPETCSITTDYGRDTCHVCYHVMPTGAFPQCTSRGLFDVNGNVWEVVTSPEDSRGYEVRGGAFNCGSPSMRFECAFNASWSDLYAGFRCCKDLP